VQLHNIDLGKLIAAAGGDPWQVNASLQSGRPAQIAQLGQAFHNAGQCTAEADNAFVEAYRRFEASWNRDNGEHPINDSAEVQRTIRSLRGQATQLPKIAVDLENIAAALAEAQRTCGVLVSTLEAQLTEIDKQIGAAEELEKTGHLSAADKEALDQLIASLEHTAIDDTKSTVAQLQSIRAGYSEYLQKSLTNLRTDGYDPDAIHGVDAEQPKDQVPGDIPPSGLEASELADIKRVTNQAVVDQMAKVRAAQKAVDDALATAYTKGPSSPEGQAALTSLPQLKKNLADALNDLGNLPDYTIIDPSTLRTSPDGHFLFGYTADGQPVQVTGQLKNGTGEIFDQGTQTYYTFKDGKLIGTRTLDAGRAEGTDEPLLTAVTLAVGAPALKAGGEAAWQGLKTLLERQVLGSGADITSDNVLPRAVAAAETRAQGAAQGLATDHPLPPSPTATSDHPVPLTTSEHPLPGTSSHAPGEHGGSPVSGDHPPAVADRLPPVVIDPGGPEFNLDNPLEIMTPELRALSEQHLTGSGETVLGPYEPVDGGPSYIKVAQDHGASYFDIGDAWSAATPTERLAANQHVLDMAIVNRDTITLSVPFNMIKPNSFTAAEIRYLELHGYRQISDTTWIPSGGGG
jgi:hypothetical protein